MLMTAWVNAHRKHSSTSVFLLFSHEKYFGLLLKNEVESLEKALNTSRKPFTAVIGGAKIAGKIDCNVLINGQG